MSAPLFKWAHFDALNRYRITLHQAFETTERIKADLGLASDQAFIRLHQPALEHMHIQVQAQLRYWPEILEWPYRIFYEQSDLVADLERFSSDYFRVVDALTRSERKKLLSTLDLSQPPFELNGRLKILSPTAGYPFAMQVKQQIFDLWIKYDRAAFTAKDLYSRSSLVLPRLVDFMQGAINAYAKNRKLDPMGSDGRIVGVRAMINDMKNLHAQIADATRDLGEGYANLASFLSGSLSDFKDLFTSISIERFGEMIESAMPRLELAEKLISHTRQ